MSLSLTALKASETTITIDGNGVPTGYAGIVNLGSSLTLNHDTDGDISTLLSGASQVQGTIGGIIGWYLSESSAKWQSVSTVTVKGQDGFWSTGGGVPNTQNGASAQLTEGAHLVCGELISGAGQDNNGGNGGTSGGSGGNATAVLNPASTSFSFNIFVGADGNYNGSYSGSAGTAGNCSVSHASTQTTATYQHYFWNQSNSATLTMAVTGGSLTDIYTTFGNVGWTPSAGPSIDFSGTIASDTGATTSLDNIVNACIATGISNGTLNIAGTCGAAGAQTLIDIATLIGMGWTVSNN